MEEADINLRFDFEPIREQIAQNKLAEAVSLLENIPALHLTYEEMAVFTTLVCELPLDAVRESTELCYKMALMHILKGNMRKAKTYTGALNSKRDKAKEGSPERAILDNRLFVLGIASPQKDNSNLLLNLAVLAHSVSEEKIPSAHISVTTKFPSVLRGDKDLSDWGKNYRAVESIIRPYLGVLLEDDAAGVCDVGVAELLYEKNNTSDASLRVMAGVNMENPEIAFAALATMARIGTVGKAAKPPEEVIPYIESMLQKKNALDLLPNFEAFKVRFAILRGELDAVRQWLDTCEIDDLNDCNKINSYRLITKAKAYIALGEYNRAATLLESIMLMLQAYYRPLDMAECLINSAIAIELLGRHDIAFQKIEKALLIAQEYGYIRVFADHGKQAFHLLVKYAKDQASGEEINEVFLKKVTTACSEFSLAWPAIYEPRDNTRKNDAPVELTQSEIHILQLLDAGNTNNAIAKELNIKIPTVKFHISNICEKLSASNRVEAIKAARNQGLLAQ